MKQLSVSELQILQGGICVNRDDPGQETSGVFCPGFCMATQIVGGINGVVCIA